MNSTPTGTVTFLFTDIEGSTMSWEHNPAQMSAALARHDDIMRAAIEAHGGYIFKTVGDAFYAAFPTAIAALSTCVTAQRTLQSEDWSSIFRETLSAIRVRMALHTGASEERDGDYFGQPLNRVARLMSAGHGNQILLSQPTYELVRDHLPPLIQLRDMGEHRLKDLIRPEHIYQLLVPGLPSDFPLLRTLDYHPNNLPAQPTPFIGRERELDNLCALLKRDDARLVTLTGPGGTGKTRLALQVTADLLDDFSDGAWFVELAPITNSSLVLSTIAQTLGVQEAGGQHLIDTLISHLKEKRLLLLLDNFEQVSDVAPDVAKFISSCSRLKILVTSRIPLRIRGEREYSVPPLALPNIRMLPTLERLSQFEAVRLFIDRATDVKAAFQITNDNAPAVAEICVRLDGLPLAIELAAARSKILSPQAMLSRLQSRLNLLIGGAKDLPARQQTLRNTMEWSYDLLDEGEKQLFRRMAIFQGGRTLMATEAVCNSEGDLQIDVLEGMSSLVDNSLLRQEDGVSGEPRFVMLETIHEFARGKLEESGEVESLGRQHAIYFLALAELADQHSIGASQAEWFERLYAEHDNLRAALHWATLADSQMALRMAGALGRFWDTYNYLIEGRQLISGLLSQPETASSTPARAKALFWLGRFIHGNGDLPAARGLLEESMVIARQIGDAEILAPALRGLGAITRHEGKFEESRALHEESLGLYRALGDKAGIRWALLGLGNLASDMGDHASARTYYEGSLALAREAGHKNAIAIALNNLGETAMDQGDFVAARAFMEQSVTAYKEMGKKAEHDPGTLMNLARLAAHDGQYKLARVLFNNSLSAARELDSGSNIAAALVYLASLELLQNHPYRATTLLAAIEALIAAAESFLEYSYRPEYERNLAAARAQLVEESWQKAWQKGQTMRKRQVIDYALEATDDV